MLSINRYRAGKYWIPLFLIFYLFMAMKPGREIFPFFSWTLFSGTPGWDCCTPYGLKISSIDGVPILPDFDVSFPDAARSVDGEPEPIVPELASSFLIPGRDIRDVKVLAKAGNICRRSPGKCDGAVKELLYPVVKKLTGSDNVEFSVVRMHTNMRDVQRDIRKLAEGRVRISDYYRVRETLGRWMTGSGR